MSEPWNFNTRPKYSKRDKIIEIGFGLGVAGLIYASLIYSVAKEVIVKTKKKSYNK